MPAEYTHKLSKQKFKNKNSKTIYRKFVTVAGLSLKVFISFAVSSLSCLWTDRLVAHWKKKSLGKMLEDEALQNARFSFIGKIFKKISA